MANEKLEDKSCPLGCNEGDTHWLSGRDILHNKPGIFNVVECNRCKLLRTNPRVISTYISEYYPENYLPYQMSKISTRKRANKIHFIKEVAKKLFKFNDRPIPKIPIGDMLEIGCASGSFLEEMHALGWKVEGLETSTISADHARDQGFTVQVNSLENAFFTKSFDLIVGWFVVEHLNDLEASLDKLRKHLKQDGVFVFSVPNAGSLEAKIFGRYWYALQLPTHYYHFSPKTITRLLEANGWKVEKIQHQRIISNIFISTGLYLRENGINKLGELLIRFPNSIRGFHFIFYPIAYLLSIFGQTGRMTVTAKLTPKMNEGTKND